MLKHNLREQSGEIGRFPGVGVEAAVDVGGDLAGADVDNGVTPGIGIIEMLDEGSLDGEQFAAGGDRVGGVAGLELDQVGSVLVEAETDDGEVQTPEGDRRQQHQVGEFRATHFFETTQ